MRHFGPNADPFEVWIDDELALARPCLVGLLATPANGFRGDLDDNMVRVRRVGPRWRRYGRDAASADRFGLLVVLVAIVGGEDRT